MVNHIPYLYLLRDAQHGTLNISRDRLSIACLIAGEFIDLLPDDQVQITTKGLRKLQELEQIRVKEGLSTAREMDLAWGCFL